jgi:hypothetical protein
MLFPDDFDGLAALSERMDQWLLRLIPGRRRQPPPPPAPPSEPPSSPQRQTGSS